MSLSVRAKVMSCGEEISHKQTTSSILELLRGIPDFCNVSSRRKQDNVIVKE
jgi:hypothetical protein